MNSESDFEILLVAPPGLEATLAEEARAAGFADAAPIAGGVTIRGGWPTVWRANLVLRGASRVLARIGSFRAMHLAQLYKRARRVPWAEFLRPDVPFRVEASCTRSRIYHKGAAAQRIARAISDAVGAPEVQGPGGYGPGMMWGYEHGPGMLGPVMMVLVVAILVAVVVLAVRHFAGHQHPHHGSKALEILKERFARGEIDADDFKIRRQMLNE